MQAPRLRWRLPREGFSLLELIISIGIVAVALLVVATVFISVLKSGAKNTDLETGTLVAQSQLNQVIFNVVNLNGYTNTTRANVFSNPTTIVTSTVALNNQVYSYNVTTQPIPLDLVHNNNLLAVFTVQVWWSSATGERQGQGRTSQRQAAQRKAGSDR